MCTRRYYELPNNLTDLRVVIEDLVAEGDHVVARYTESGKHTRSIDVDPEVFVRKLKDANADILGSSALLTTTVWKMKNVIDKVIEAGIGRNKGPPRWKCCNQAFCLGCECRWICVGCCGGS
jgi:hypothetical protein